MAAAQAIDPVYGEGDPGAFECMSVYEGDLCVSPDCVAVGCLKPNPRWRGIARKKDERSATMFEQRAGSDTAINIPPAGELAEAPGAGADPVANDPAKPQKKKRSPRARAPKAPEAKGAQGRKDEDHQEQPIKLGMLKDRVQELLKLGRRVENAKVDYAEAVKTAAQAAGLQTSVVRRFIAARLGEKWENKVRDARQLALVFDEVGEG